MDDMFWHMERSEALKAIRWAVDSAWSSARDAVKDCGLLLLKAPKKVWIDLGRSQKNPL